MNQLVVHKRYTVILLVAFLMSTLVPVLKVYELHQFVSFGSATITVEPSAASRAIAQVSEDEAQVLLCTATGFKWVSVAELESGSLQSSHSYFDCASCCSMVHDAKQGLLAANPFSGERHDLKAPQYAAVNVVARTQIYVRGILVRGPPLTV